MIRDIERERIEWVYGLTGGELETSPWQTAAPSVYQSDGSETGDWLPWPWRYWYEGTPEYATRELGADYAADFRFRTIVVDYGGLYSPSPRLFDAETGREWRLIASYAHNGETECPGRHSDCPTVEPSDGVACALCEEPIGSPHGYILGNGCEAVYRVVPLTCPDCGAAMTDDDECNACEGAE